MRHDVFLLSSAAPAHSGEIKHPAFYLHLDAGDTLLLSPVHGVGYVGTRCPRKGRWRPLDVSGRSENAEKLRDLFFCLWGRRTRDEMRNRNQLHLAHSYRITCLLGNFTWVSLLSSKSTKKPRQTKKKKKLIDFNYILIKLFSIQEKARSHLLIADNRTWTITTFLMLTAWREQSN